MRKLIQIKYLFIIWLLFSHTESFAQYLNKTIFLVDSIKKETMQPEEFQELEKTVKQFHQFTNDSDKVKLLSVYIENCLNDLVWPRYNKLCFELCDKNIKITTTEKEKKFFLQYKGNCINNFGVIALNRGDLTNALKHFKEGLIIAEQINYELGISQGLNNVGYIYQEQGNLPLALETHFKSLKIKDKLHDSSGLGFAYNNIAYIYQLERQTAEALKYNHKALEIRTKIKDAEGTHLSLLNIAAIKQSEGDLKEALLLYKKSLKIAQDANYLKGQAQSTRGICNNFLHNQQFDSAKYFCIQAIELCKSLEYYEGLLNCYIDMTNISLNNNKLSEAETYALKSLPIAEAIASVENLQNVYDLLYRIYKEKGDNTKALAMHEKLSLFKDSLLNIENKSSLIRNQLEYDHEKQKAIQEAKHQKDVEIADQIKKKQRLAILAIIVILLIISISAFILKKRLTITRKQKQIIEEQKHLVDEKQKEIIDSIRYAKRIQQAILKSEEHESKHLPEHFILFKPKDIVSGDFYWAFEKNNFLYLAAADCTGHGVPGAFLTMLGISFLNEICAVEQIYTPAEILNQLRNRITKELNQKGANVDTKDGMDISLLRLNLQTLEINWAGANNPIYFIKNNELSEIKPDKQPVGYSYNPTPFSNQTIQLKKGDYICIFTDGFADQFGGEKGKKYKYSALKTKLVEINNLDMQEQKEILNNEFENWKGNLEQVDDVTIIGLRV